MIHSELQRKLQELSFMLDYAGTLGTAGAGQTVKK